jgi:hypothetical protein
LKKKAVRLKRRAVGSRPSTLSRSVESAFLAVLMYFPPREIRELASDLMQGAVPTTPANVGKVIEAIGDYDVERLASADPNCNVFRARDVLKKYVGKPAPARPRARAKRVIGRKTKCR